MIRAILSYGSAAIIALILVAIGAVACGLRGCVGYQEISATAFIVITIVMGTIFLLASEEGRPL